jgi:hypothetical protein
LIEKSPPSYILIVQYQSKWLQYNQKQIKDDFMCIRLFSFIILISLGLAVSSCATTSSTRKLANTQSFVPETQIEAGLVTVSTSTILPWYEISDSLKPKFTATSAEDLLNIVLPITSNQYYGSNNSSAAGVTLGLPGTTVLNTNTGSVTEEISSDGTKTSSSNNSKTKSETINSGSVTAPELRKYETSDLNQNQSPSVSGLDPFLQYRTATALFQEIQMLNNYLNRNFKKEFQVPYLFRSQINIQPYSRNMAVDTFVEIAVETKGRNSENRPVVIPLIITDNLERASAQKLEQAIRDLRLSLSGLIGQVGVGAGTQSLKEEIAKLDAFDYNSLVTVAATDVDELTVRIGAQRSSSGLAAVARSYDITYLVLWPKDNCDPEGTKLCQGQINYFPHMRSTVDGRRLPLTSPTYQSNIINRIIDIMLARGVVKSEIEKTEKKLPHAFTIDFYEVIKVLDETEHLPKGRTWQDDAEINQITASYFDTLDRRMIDIEFELTGLRLPNEATAVLRDSGSGSASVLLSSQSRLPSLEDIDVKLIINTDRSQVKLGTLSKSQDSHGLLTFTFPSPSALGLRDNLLNNRGELRISSEGSQGQLALFLESEKTGNDVFRNYPILLDRKVGTVAVPRLFNGRLFPNTPKVSEDSAEVRLVIDKVSCPSGAECPNVESVKVSLTNFPLKKVKINDSDEPSFNSIKNSFIGKVGNAYQLIIGSMDAEATATIELQAINSEGKAINQQTSQSITITAK